MNADSSDDRRPHRDSRPSLQFSLGFLVVVTLITALGALATQQLLIAWEVPRRRAVFTLVVVMLPTATVCVMSLFYRLWHRWFR